MIGQVALTVRRTAAGFSPSPKRGYGVEFELQFLFHLTSHFPLTSAPEEFVATNLNPDSGGDGLPQAGRREFVATNLLLPLPRLCRPYAEAGA